MKRDAWSLTWDAFLEQPAQGSGGKTSILQGFKQVRRCGDRRGRTAVPPRHSGRCHACVLPHSCPCLLRRILGSLCCTGAPNSSLPCPPVTPSVPRTQEVIHLGKWATREQAGRAVDIASIKLLGEGAQVGRCMWYRCMWCSKTQPHTSEPMLVSLRLAGAGCCRGSNTHCRAEPLKLPNPLQTNFPAQTYSKALPALAAHSGDQVVAALKKDSALSLTRTSKFRGTRRIGPGQYEARLPPKPAPAPAAAAAAAGGSTAAAAAGTVPGVTVPAAAVDEAAALQLHAQQAQQEQMQQFLLQQQYAAAQFGQFDAQQAAVLPIVGMAALPMVGHDDLLGFDALGPAADGEVQHAEEASWDFGDAD